LPAAPRPSGLLGMGGWPTLSLSTPHDTVGAPLFAESTLVLLVLGAKGRFTMALRAQRFAAFPFQMDFRTMYFFAL
jgi:hypothetical protein